MYGSATYQSEHEARYEAERADYAGKCDTLRSDPSPANLDAVFSAIGVSQRLERRACLPVRFNSAALSDLPAGPTHDALAKYVRDLPSVRDYVLGSFRRETESGWRGPISKEYDTVTISRHLCIGAKGFALYGPVGVGKTHAMAATLRAIAADYHEPEFVSATRLAMDLRGCFAGDGNGPDEIIGPLTKVAILAIDDFDKITAGSVFIADAIFELINTRYERQLPICITSNLAPEQIQRNFSKFPEHGDAIVDRLREMVGFWVSIKGTSRRRAA